MRSKRYAKRKSVAKEQPFLPLGAAAPGLLVPLVLGAFVAALAFSAALALSAFRRSRGTVLRGSSI